VRRLAKAEEQQYSQQAGAPHGRLAARSETAEVDPQGVGQHAAILSRSVTRESALKHALSLVKTSSDSLSSTEIGQSVHRPKTPGPGWR